MVKIYVKCLFCLCLCLFQGLKLQMTSQKSGVGDQNFTTGNSKVKGFYFKENIKLLWTIVVKRSNNFIIAIFN